MSEPEQVIDQANAFLSQLTMDYLDGLAIDAMNDLRSAEKCGCLNCLRQAEKAYFIYEEEDGRLNNWHPDEEEEWILNKVLDEQFPDHAIVGDSSMGW